MNFRIIATCSFLFLALTATPFLAIADEQQSVSPAAKQEKLIDLAISHLKAYLMGDSKALFENSNIPLENRKSVDPLINEQVTSMKIELETGLAREDGVRRVDYIIEIQRGESRKTKIYPAIECIFVQGKWSIVGMEY